MAILVTGGAGYIGSHTCVELLNAGEEIVVLDNFCNSKPRALEIVKELTGKDFKSYNADLLDRAAVEKVFEENKIDSVIHFAGLKAVGESVRKPIEYYHNNITGTLILCDVMRNHGCKRIVFSSSATVYGSPKSVPIREDFPLSTTNPYGSTKLMIEGILKDIYTSDNGIPNNLMPYIQQVAVGKLPELGVFGNDYPTHDGTGVRDYIHVVDLALGHVKAIQKVRSMTGVGIWNLGTGKGYSVLDVVNAFIKASGVNIPYVIKPRRAGDIAECYADPEKAAKELGWRAERGIEEMCEDSWRFIKNNPEGL